MARIKETVLYYNPGTEESMAHVAKLKSVLVRMGVRIRNIGPEQAGETVGFLAGLEGFEKREEDSGELPEMTEEMLVLKQFSGKRLDELLLNLRRAGVPRIALKAVLTEHNAKWPFYQLYEELKAEHAQMNQPERRENEKETAE